MPLKPTLSLMVHLLLAGWMGLAISGSSLGVRHGGQDLAGSKKFQNPIIDRVRKPRNTYESEQGEINKPPPRFLYMRNSPQDTTGIQSRDSAILECEAGGSPPPVIHWLKNGIEIGQADFLSSNLIPDIEAIPSGLSSTNSRLFVDCMQASDVGAYTCVATTPYQRVTADTSVFLAPTDLSVGINPSCQRQTSLVLGPRSQPARIHMWMSRILQTIGQDVLLFCRTLGDPSPSIQWTMNEGKAIPINGRHQILDNGDLLIKNVKWSDMGEYSCEAANRHGKDRVTTFLYPMASEEK